MSSLSYNIWTPHHRISWMKFVGGDQSKKIISWVSFREDVNLHKAGVAWKPTLNQLTLNKLWRRLSLNQMTLKQLWRRLSLSLWRRMNLKQLTLKQLWRRLNLNQLTPNNLWRSLSLNQLAPKQLCKRLSLNQPTPNKLWRRRNLKLLYPRKEKKNHDCSITRSFQ
ncbi:hypothetical protein COCON_G00120850 [Conger conger]|uniref:Uncharacterized protein n=1 Tax=Conger conger TaxID=82655 RepID=A0A9Q1DGZ5_CONCO|nr:hypothetical protein COCON_G00120850 [Conger conger]